MSYGTTLGRSLFGVRFRFRFSVFVKSQPYLQNGIAFIWRQETITEGTIESMGQKAEARSSAT